MASINPTHSVAAELEGALLVSKSTFPYLMLVAFEAGGLLRATTLLLVFPFLRLLEYCTFSGWDEVTTLEVMIFISTAGLKMSGIEAVAKANLCRFYLEDMGEEAYRVFSSSRGKKYVVTHIPKVMVEPFLEAYLDVDYVIGTELRTAHGYCLGLVASPGLLMGGGAHEFESLGEATGVTKELIDVGLCGGGQKQHPFMSLCREKYVINTEGENATVLPRSGYPKPFIFHDGRLVSKPTPTNALTVLLWMPFGFLLSIVRIMAGALLPYKLGILVLAATGFRVRADDVPSKSKEKGTLFVCSHRTLLDPVTLSLVLQRRVMAVTYSLSRVSELLSPIATYRLNRDRSKDGEMMRGLLEQGDLVVCPEGTTCREPYLLRFSPLFAEITEEDNIVPVGITVEGSIFYGTTVRGYKWLDSFFFLMNPTPCYHLIFLQKKMVMAMENNSGGEKSSSSSIDIANKVQRLIADAMGFQCTSYTRRDKYRMIAGNDGVVCIKGPRS